MQAEIVRLSQLCTSLQSELHLRDEQLHHHQSELHARDEQIQHLQHQAHSSSDEPDSAPARSTSAEPPPTLLLPSPPTHDEQADLTELRQAVHQLELDRQRLIDDMERERHEWELHEQLTSDQVKVLYLYVPDC